jgi:hypothetical protein
MEEKVLKQVPDPNLRTYVVWVPKKRGLRRDVPTAASTVEDSRVLHYWDGDSLLVNAYRDVLRLGEDAWDVFLLYGADAKWDGDRPPAPDYWAHQIGEPEKPRVLGPWFTGDVFLRQTQALLGRQP